MVKVSVIVSIYNTSAFLDRCLYSIVNQTLKDIEIILINDGSTGDSKIIIDKYMSEYKNIILIDKKIEGLGKARNAGIKKATGEYITFVDSDDYIKENMMEVFYEYAKKNSLDMVTSTYYKVKNNKEILWKAPKYKMGNVKTSPNIILSIEYAPWAKLYKRSIVIENNIFFEENKKYEDMSFVCKCLLKSKLVGQLPEGYYYYVINNSQTTTMDKKVFDILDILKTIMDYYKREFYLKEEVNYVVIDKVTTYMLQQRVQKDKKIRNDFISAGYKFLDDNINNWKNNKYYKKTSFCKRIIKNNPKLLRRYCTLYSLFKRK